VGGTDLQRRASGVPEKGGKGGEKKVFIGETLSWVEAMKPYKKKKGKKKRQQTSLPGS